MRCTARPIMAVALVATAMLLRAVPADAAEGTGQPPNAIGVRLLDAPVDRRDDPRASRAIIDHLQPGDQIERRMLVVNTYDEGYDVPVYAEGATVENSSFRAVGKDADQPQIVDWISVSPSPLSLTGQSSGEVIVAIDVPTDAPDGEFYAIVFAESPGQGQQVQLVNRAGVRIYLSVGAGAEPASDFAVDALVARRNEQGQPEVSVVVRNTGQRALDLVGELTLSEGPGGLSAGPFTAEGTTTLGIGASGELFVPLDPALPDGPWEARMAVRSGEVERVAQATITFPSANGVTSDPAPAEEIDARGGDIDGDGVNDDVENQRRVLLPLAALLVLLAIVGLWLLLMWKRRDEEEEDEDASSDDASATNDETPAKAGASKE